MNIQFGSGVLYGNPVAGNQPANPTPFKFGVLQECTVDFKGDLKKLFGQYQLAVATARGKLETTIKGKLAVFDPNLLNQLYFAQPSANVTSGYNLIVDGESNGNANSYTVTNAGSFQEDWGVVDALSGQNYINQPNLAATVLSGQYSVNVLSGTYKFNSNVDVLISYTYNVATGQTILLKNQLMGYAPELKMLLYNKFRNKYFAIELNDVTLGSINAPTKLEDFWIADFDGSANADASNVLGKLMMDLN